MDKLIFWLSVLVMIFAASIIAGVVWFGLRVFYERWNYPHPFIEHVMERWLHGPRPPRADVAAQVMSDSISNYRERRNEYWTTYGQIVLSIFIVALLSVLLLTKTINADAGLPILSGISGFAIAKTVNAGTSGRGPAAGGGEEGTQ
jgi:hypothetical protein